ncbi:hypothetical protein PO909_017137, partial [Leuciscus waleckii]
ASPRAALFNDNVPNLGIFKRVSICYKRSIRETEDTGMPFYTKEKANIKRRSGGNRGGRNFLFFSLHSLYVFPEIIVPEFIVRSAPLVPKDVCRGLETTGAGFIFLKPPKMPADFVIM